MRAVLFFYIGVVLAAVAWRYTQQAWPILLLPVIWACGRQRLDGFLLFLGYYLMFAIDAPAALVKFDADTGKVFSMLLWFGHAAVLALPWLPVAKTKWKQAAIVIPATALPPFGAFNWGHPLLAAGDLLPGGGISGLFLCYAMVVWAIWLIEEWMGFTQKARLAAAIPAYWFVCVAIAHHVFYQTPQLPAGWVAVNTRFGGNNGLMPHERHIEMAKSAIQSGGAGNGRREVIVFPENPAGKWNDIKPVFWHEAKDSAKTLLVGAKVETSDGTFLNAAVDPRTGVVITSARVPMPVGVWNFTGESSESNLFDSNVHEINHVKTSIIFCYEEALIYPIAFDAVGGATAILSMANLWSTKPIAREMQRRSIWLQAKLYGLPLIRAVNI